MEGCVLATIICFIINPLDFLYLLFQINNNQNRKPNFCISKAPIKYATAGEKEVIFTCCLFSSLTSLLNQFMLILMQDIHSELLEYMCVSLQKDLI